MSLLICVKSCERDCQNGFNQAVRDTWGQQAANLGVDVKFFVGIGERALQKDEIRVFAGDDYDSLPYKTHAICKWVENQHQDFFFFCDTDTFLKVDLLLKLPFEKADYSGYYHDGKLPGTRFSTYRDDRGNIIRGGAWWASGGVGYSLSKKAVKEIARQSKPTHWAEDFWVGQVLNQAGDMVIVGLESFNHEVSWHFNQRHRPYDVSWMYDAYKKGAPW